MGLPDLSDDLFPFQKTLEAFRQQLNWLRWAIPLGMLLLVVFFEFGPLRWIYDRYGLGARVIVEVALFGTLGPGLAFFALTFIGRWLEERETSELQAQILARAREQSAANHQLSDDVLQGLFAVSMLLESTETPAQSPEAKQRLQEAKNTLDLAIRRLRVHITEQPPHARP